MQVVVVALGAAVGTLVGVVLGFAVLGAIVRAADDLRGRPGHLADVDLGATDYAVDDLYSFRGQWR